MFTEARGVAKLLNSMSEGEGAAGGIVDIHWDILQVGFVSFDPRFSRSLALILDH